MRKKRLLFLTLLMTFCSFLFAQSDTYTPHYTYEMGLFEGYAPIVAEVSIGGESQQSKTLELAVFNADICVNSTFISEKDDKFRLNAYGDYGDIFTFKMYDHATGKEYTENLITVGGIMHESLQCTQDAYDGAYAYPDPITIDFEKPLHFVPVVDDEDDGGHTMSIAAVVYIDDVEQKSDKLELGVFCGDECRGSMMTDHVSGVHYLAYGSFFGKNGDIISFKLYNHETEEELIFNEVTTIEYDENGAFGTDRKPEKIYFKTVEYVAQINETKYATLAEAIENVKDGETIILLKDIDEVVTIVQESGLSFTIDGQDKTYSGTINIDGNNRPNGAETLTIKNIDFINTSATTYAYFIDATKNAKGGNSEVHNLTVENCYFQSTNWHYAIATRHPYNLVVKGCEAQSVYYFIYNPQGGQSMTIEDCNVTSATYGIGAQKCKNVVVRDYTYTGKAAGFYGRATSNGPTAVLENVDITTTLSDQAAVAYWKNNDGNTSVIYTFNFLGENKLATPEGTASFAAESETNAPYQILLGAEDATLAATENLNVESGVESYKVIYDNGVYSLKRFSTHFKGGAYSNYSQPKNREHFGINLYDVYAETSLVVKVYHNDELLLITTLREYDLDDPDKKLYPCIVTNEKGITVANVVNLGEEGCKPAGSWLNEWQVAPTVANVPNKFEVYVDGIFADELDLTEGEFAGFSSAAYLQKYLAFKSVYKAASVTRGEDVTYYMTLAEAFAAATEDGDKVTLYDDADLASRLDVTKNITLNLNGKNITANFEDQYGAIYVKKGAELTIEGEGDITSNSLAIGTYGTVNIKGGNITTTGSDDAALYVFYYQPDYEGTANISGGRLNVVWNCGTLNVSGGQIDYLDTSSELDVTGGVITKMYAQDGSDANGAYEMNIKNIETTVPTVEVPADYKFVEIRENVYQVVAKNYIAQTETGAKFETLQEAIDAANETVTLLQTATGAGAKINKDITIDFGGYEYSFNEGVGSGSYTSNGFQLLGGNVVLKNGTLNVAEADASEFYILVQNYTNLTVDNMTLDGTYLDKWSKSTDPNNGDSYVLSNNSGTVNIINTKIYANNDGDKAFAFDVDDNVNYTSKPVVNVSGENTLVSGKLEVDLPNNLNISGGLFTEPIAEAWCAEGYFPTEVEIDGTTYYTVHEGLLGSGTESDPFIIRNLGELKFFRDHVNAGKTTYNAEGVYVALAANIDMATEDWSVNIGDDCNYTFDGIFDGCNFVLYNLNSVETAQKADGYVCTGLFGAIYSSAVVKNLTIENVNITTADFTGNNAAAVVGFVYGVNGKTTTIENVTVKGDVTINASGVYGVGAIVGYSHNAGTINIKNCKVQANDGSAITAVSGSGAIIGYCGGNATIDGCTVDNIDITGKGLVGGIAGITSPSNNKNLTNNTVKNVNLTATKAEWANSAAIAVGTMHGDGLTVANTTFENVNANRMVGSVYAEQPTSVVPAVQAKIENKYYGTFDAALAAAQAGNTITVLDPVVVTENKTYDLTDLTVVGENVYPIFRIQDGATMTVQGGEVTNPTDYVFVLGASDGSSYGNLVINGGKYHGATTVASVTKGNLLIEGGEFSIEPYEGNYTFLINCIDANYNNGSAKVEIKGGTFHNFDPENNAAEGAGTNFCAEGYVSDDNGNGTWTVRPGVYVAQITETGVKYESLQAAYDAAEEANEIVLLQNVELAQLFKVEKNVILNLNEMTVTSTAQKAFEVYADATFKNGTIIAKERSVDTRKAVELTLESVNLNSTGNGNTQPLTIGGSENGTKVSMTDVSINAGAKGYGIIAFVKTELTAVNSDIAGYSALYVKSGSDESAFSFVNSVLSGSDANYYSQSSSFATIVVVANNVTVNVDTDSKVIANGDFCYALALGSSYAGDPSTVAGANVTVAGEIVADKMLGISEFADNIIKVREDYAQVLNAEGFAVSEADADGLVTVMEAVAKVGEKYYATLADAYNAAVNDDVVTLLKDATGAGLKINKSVTIDFGGFTYTINQAVGSNGTESQGFQLLKNNTVTLMNGNIAIAEGTNVKWMFNAYADVTLQNLNVDCANMAEAAENEKNYVLVVNNGGGATPTVNYIGVSYVNFQANNAALYVDPSTELVAEAGLNVETCDGYVVVYNNGKYTAIEIVSEEDAVAKIGDIFFKTFADAYETAVDGNTIVILKDIAFVNIVEIHKNITIDINGNTLTGTADKFFRVFADVRFENGNIVNTAAKGRCVETRTADITLELDNVTLIAENGASQPLTIGGNGDNITVNINASNIDAGKYGYAIIVFNPVMMTIDNSVVEGWSALYFKGTDNSLGSAGSVVNVNASEFITVNTVANSDASNTFATIQFEDENIELNVTGKSLISAHEGEHNHQYAFALAVTENIKINVEKEVVIDATHFINCELLGNAEIVLPYFYRDDINEEGFWAEPYGDEQIIVRQQFVAVASIGETLYQSLEEAVEAAVAGNEIVLLRDVETKNDTYDLTDVTLNLNTKTISTQSLFSGDNYTITNGTSSYGLNISGNNVVINNVIVNGSINVNNASVVTLANNTVNATDSYAVYAGENVTDLEIKSGTYYGAEGFDAVSHVEGSVVTTTGGTYNSNVELAGYCPEGYYAKDNGDDTWTVLKSAVLNVELAEGWNWFSSYVNIDGTQGFSLVSNAMVGIVSQIKADNGQYSNYNNAFGEWTGSLVSTSTDKMYKVLTSHAGTVIYEGTAANEIEITLYPGLNWIAYPVDKPLNIVDAFRNHVPTNGDQLITKDTYVEYTDFGDPEFADWNGWYETNGDLNVMTLIPGQGYIYDSKADAPVSFTYNTDAPAANAKSRIVDNGYWNVNPYLYPSNMTITAVLNIDGELAEGNYEIAAFSNGECRGSSKLVYCKPLDQYMVRMLVHGDGVENLTFKCYDMDADKVYDLDNLVVYSDNARLGDMREPYVFSRNTMGVDDNSAQAISVYPNPSTTDSEINLNAVCDKVEVFNALGVKIAEYDNVDSIDPLQTAGVYVIRLSNNNEVTHCRLVVK